MSVETVMARIAEINGMLAPPRPAEPAAPAPGFDAALTHATGAAGMTTAAPALSWNAAGRGGAGVHRKLRRCSECEGPSVFLP